MTAMTIGVPEPLMPPLREWTVADLDGLPDDGLQYELLDGMLLVSPAPIAAHQRVSGNLFFALRTARPAGVEVFTAPFEWRPDAQTSLQPDLLVFRQEDVGLRNITVPFLLAVEILSPSTRRKDLLLKRSKYEDEGIAAYWVVDPDQPSLTAYDLVDGQFHQVAKAHGDEVADLVLPFPIRITPSALLVP